MSILQHNGSAVIAMAGNKCVGIASDRRFGAKQQTIGMDMQRVFKINNRTLIGFGGLATDVSTVYEDLKMKTDLYKLREDRDIKVKTFDNLVSNYLYSKRFGPFFIEPVIAGLDGDDFTPFLSGQDLIGMPVFTENFVVVGTAESSLYGVCETFYKPDLGPDELSEVMAQCIVQATDRDCLSGYGATIYILTPDRLIVREVQGRHD
jgi:20S proteasome subunit beta 3